MAKLASEKSNGNTTVVYETVLWIGSKNEARWNLWCGLHKHKRFRWRPSDSDRAVTDFA